MTMASILIQNVENLTIVQNGKPAIPRPRDRRRRAHMAAHLPLAIVPTCKGRGLAWPHGGLESSAVASAPPMQMLRAAIRKPCPTCGDKGVIERNNSGEVGDFETAPCPACRRERRAE